MNTSHFHPARFRDFVRKDFREHLTPALGAGLILYLAMATAFVWFDLRAKSRFLQELPASVNGGEAPNSLRDLIMEEALQGTDQLWYAIGTLTTLFFCPFMAFAGSRFLRESRRRRGYARFLTLPVSPAERFAGRALCLLLLSLAVFCCSTLLADLTRVGGTRWMDPEIALSFPVPWWSGEGYFLPEMFLCGIAFHALFVLGSTYWPHGPFRKTAGAYLLSASLLATAYIISVSSLQPEYGHHPMPGNWQAFWLYGVNAFCILFCYALAYFRLKHAALLPSWNDRTTRAVLVAFALALVLCVAVPHYNIRHFPYHPTPAPPFPFMGLPPQD